jgi:hypothetical protein
MTVHRYVARTHVARVEERFEKRRRPGTTGVGLDADMIDVSTGWWIVTEAPEPYATRVGSERPIHRVGQVVRLALEFDE